MRHYFVLGIVLALPACGRTVEAPRSGHAELPPVEAGGLRPVSDFETITDPTARSAAMFLEASRVLTHPRCLNCHPAGDTPLQGESMMVHEPPVTRGVGNRGVVGMECTSCHQDENLELARVPGAPDWHLAPIQAAWVGRSPRQICEQLKDPKLNGKRTLEDIVEHSENDRLVAWGWQPGHGREPAPGSQAAFAALIRGWVEAGAACPAEGSTP